MKELARVGAAVASWGLVGAAMAGCNNPSNWLESPSDGVKLLIGEQQTFASTGFALEPTNGLDYPPFSPAPPEELLKCARKTEKRGGRLDLLLRGRWQGWLADLSPRKMACSGCVN